MKCAFTYPVRTECGMFVMCCMSVSAVLLCCLEEVYIDVGYCDMFSVVNVYLNQWC